MFVVSSDSTGNNMWKRSLRNRDLKRLTWIKEIASYYKEVMRYYGGLI